jgi:hypothetical protein
VTTKNAMLRDRGQVSEQHGAARGSAHVQQRRQQPGTPVYGAARSPRTARHHGDSACFVEYPAHRMLGRIRLGKKRIPI